MLAKVKLRAAYTMFSNAAVTPIQQEELANYIVQAEKLDDQLSEAIIQKKKNSEGKLDDRITKTLFQMKAANRNIMLAGVRKNMTAREGDVKLDQQYYDINFE